MESLGTWHFIRRDGTALYQIHRRDAAGLESVHTFARYYRRRGDAADVYLQRRFSKVAAFRQRKAGDGFAVHAKRPAGLQLERVCHAGVLRKDEKRSAGAGRKLA